MKSFKILSSLPLSTPYLYIVLLLLFISKCQSTNDPFQCFSNFYIATGRPLGSSITSINEVCNLIDIVTCDDSYNIEKIKIDQVNGAPQFSGSYLSCFEYLTEIEFESFDLGNDFLTNSMYYPQPNVKVTLTNPVSYTLGNLAPSIKSLSIYTSNIYYHINNLISLDYFINLEELNLVDSTHSGQQIIDFTGQTSLSNVIKSYNVFSKSLPPLSNMIIENIKVELQNSFIWTNYETFPLVSGVIDISSPDSRTCITASQLANSGVMSAKELNINLCITFTDSIYYVNVSKTYPELEKFKVISTPLTFQSLDFPFNSVPESLEEFTLHSSTFGSLDYAYDVLRYVTNVDLSNNVISLATLPEYSLSPGNNRVLKLSYNSLSGSVPESYCKVEDLDLSNNILTGEIPKCFHCFYSSDKFANNQFTNYNEMGNCENKIMPSLTVDSISKKIYLQGKNLGFSNQIATSPPLVWFMQIPSELFIADYSQYINSLDNTFNLKFLIPDKTFTLRTIRTKPTITQAITNKNGTIHFIGSDFVYDYSKIKVTANSYDCTVIQSSYNDIICQLNLPPILYASSMITYITIIDGSNNYTRQITIDFSGSGDYVNTIIPCVADCYNHGTCYSNIGSCICNANLKLADQNSCSLNCGPYGTFNANEYKCDCNSNYQGEYCDIPPPNSCPNDCSNAGTCSNGLCICSPGRTLNDCSGYLCPNGCTSSTQGTCDITTGICTCSSIYEGNDCSIKKCPNDCSNAGTCSNGICICNSGRTLHDCSGYLCPNGCTSSTQGTCDTITGVCNCSPDYEGNDCSIKKCPGNCSNAGTCSNGICKCNAGRALDDCSGYTCPNDCSISNGGGNCNTVTGSCICNKDRLFLDCSGISCKECLNGGSCNNTVGECMCKANWKDETCSTPVHYISSVEPCSVSGGQVVIYGWFGSIHEDLKVTIGDLECIDATSTETNITCTLEGGSGTKNVNVTQNGSSFIGKNKFQYYNPIMKCPNNCTNELKGVCDSTTGQCICSSSWSGFDCSLPSSKPSSSNIQEIPKSTTSIDISTAEATISNQDVNFEISIISLVELDISGNQVKTNLLKKNWDTQIQNSIYQFSQTIDNDGDSNDQVCLVTYTIEEVNKTKNYEYAGLKLKIEEGGLKVSVNISNYQFKSALNTLQLRFLSAVGEDSTITTTASNQCNQAQSKTNIENIDPNETLNYISITKNNKQLSGRFINKLESDSKYTFMTSEIIKDLSNSSLIVVGLNLPHCVSSCYIDPDFSVLVSPNYKSKCDSDSSKAWVIPVAVVIPSVAVVAIIITSFFVYRKYRYQIRLFVHKKSTISLRNSFKLKKKNNLYGFKG